MASTFVGFEKGMVMPNDKLTSRYIYIYIYIYIRGKTKIKHTKNLGYMEHHNATKIGCYGNDDGTISSKNHGDRGP